MTYSEAAADSNSSLQWQDLPGWVFLGHNLHHQCKEVLHRCNEALVLVWERGGQNLKAECLGIFAFFKVFLYVWCGLRGLSLLTCFSRFISCSISTSLVLALNSLRLEEELLPRPGRSHSSLYSCRCSSSFRRSSMSCGQQTGPFCAALPANSPLCTPAKALPEPGWGQSYNTASSSSFASTSLMHEKHNFPCKQREMLGHTVLQEL